MEIKQNQCIFLGHWIDVIEMLDTDLQDRIISNYVYYKIYGYHRYSDEPMIVAITKLWDAEVKNARTRIEQDNINNNIESI